MNTAAGAGAHESSSPAGSGTDNPHHHDQQQDQREQQQEQRQEQQQPPAQAVRVVYLRKAQALVADLAARFRDDDRFRFTDLADLSADSGAAITGFSVKGLQWGLGCRDEVLLGDCSAAVFMCVPHSAAVCMCVCLSSPVWVEPPACLPACLVVSPCPCTSPPATFAPQAACCLLCCVI